MSIKLSICTVTYNHEAFIANAIESIMQQTTNFFFELIIGDDCSTDATKKIINKYISQYSNIRLIERNINIGYANNLIDTVDRANGEYVAIFDGDDIMLQGKLQKQVDYLDSNPDVVLVGHAVRIFESTTGKVIRIKKPRKIRNKYTINDFLKFGSILTNSSKMFRKYAWPHYLNQYKINYIADHYVTLHLIKDYYVGYLPDVLGEYRIHSKGLMQNIDGKSTYDDIKTILLSISNAYQGKYDHLFPYLKAYGQMIYGIDQIRKNNIKEGRQLLLKSIKTKWNYTRAQYFYYLVSFLPPFLKEIFLSR